MSSTSFLGRNDLPAGIRNNNPGNLRPLSNNKKWNGEIDRDTKLNFSRFKDVEHGLRAMFIDILGDIVDDQDNTPWKLAEKYAPASDGNDPVAYAGQVALALGMKGIHEQIKPSRENMFKIIRRKIDVENGKNGKLITAAMINAGIDYALLRNDIKKKLSNQA